MADQSFEIAVDQAYPESDFDASSSASERTSLRSSVCDYIYENGRRYHAYHAGEYWGSNDEKAMDAMDILFVTRLDHDGILLTVSRHHVYSLMLNGKLYLAPIPANVDVSCSSVSIFQLLTLLRTARSRHRHWNRKMGYRLCRQLSLCHCHWNRPVAHPAQFRPAECEVRGR